MPLGCHDFPTATMTINHHEYRPGGEKLEDSTLLKAASPSEEWT